MRVLRGRGADRDADRALTTDLLERTAETGEAGLRVWRPHRQLAFGRRDTTAAGYERARELAIDHGFPPVERRVGGRPVAYTESTVALAVTLPVGAERAGIADRYDEVATGLQRALWRLGVPAQRGEPPESFCPGSHSLSWQGKIVGLAQRVQPNAALVGGVVIVTGHEEHAAVLDPIYEVLGVPFDPDTVGSIDRAGGRADPATVERVLETVLTDGAEVEVEEVEAG